ncbi:hypothetical protein PHMEG_00026323 [Phytophthora megakarya]|uniref:Uncharacterized protein n=1 Tax=Phytophthora megakarya TaxID=4795 RepID=A0A225VB31_9STRA|nr:hypothetical protein PHMEG_00026323 [Phytophthora megakarya]
MRYRDPNCLNLTRSNFVLFTVDRCIIDGCSKLTPYKGLCLGQGGGRRCNVVGCHKFRQIRDF